MITADQVANVSDLSDVLRWPALGTTAVLQVTQVDQVDAIRTVVEAEIAALDQACSRFRDDSDLQRAQANAGRPTPVSPVLIGAVEVALRAARISRGLVDPSIGSAIRVLGYDRTFAEVAADTEADEPLGGQVRIARVPGWQNVRIDHANGTLTIPKGVELDLGATAKAWGADRAARAGAALGGGVLVGLGGDLAMAGPAPDDGWSLRIADHHAAGPDAPGQIVTLHGGGLATSGTTARRWQRGGRELHHLIDPATGQPADSPWRTASVAADSCVNANIASTAAIILGATAPEWLGELGLPARLVDHQGQVRRVGGWPTEGER